MANNSSIQLQLDIDAIAGKIDTGPLSKSVEDQVKKALGSIKKSKAPIDVGFDIDKLSKDIAKGLDLITKDIDKTIKKLSEKKSLHLKISEELHKELANAKNLVGADGKILQAELEKVLKSVATTLNIKGKLTNKTNPLGDYLRLQGLSLSEANKTLKKGTDEYQKNLDKLTQLKLTSSARADKLQKELGSLSNALFKPLADSNAVFNKSVQGAKQNLKELGEGLGLVANSRAGIAALTKAIKILETALKDSGVAVKNKNFDASLKEQLSKVLRLRKELRDAGKASLAASKIGDPDFLLEALKKQKQAALETASAYLQLQQVKQAAGRPTTDANVAVIKELAAAASSLNKQISNLRKGLTAPFKGTDNLRKALADFISARDALQKAAAKTQSAVAVGDQKFTEIRLAAQTKAAFETAAAYDQLLKAKQAEGRKVTTSDVKRFQEMADAAKKLQVQLDALKTPLKVTDSLQKASADYVKAREILQKAQAKTESAIKIGDQKFTITALTAQTKAALEAAAAYDQLLKARSAGGRNVSATDVKRFQDLTEAAKKLQAQLDALKKGVSPTPNKGALIDPRLREQLQEVLKLRQAYQKARQDSQLAEQTGGSDFHLRKLSKERNALLELTAAYQRLQQIKLQSDRSTVVPGQSALRSTIVGDRTLASLSDGVKDLSGQLRGFDNLWTNAAQSMRLFFRYAIGYKILYEMLGAINALTKGVIDFQNVLVSIKAVTDSTSGEILRVGAAILSVAENTKFSVNAVAEGARTLAQAGIPIEKLGSVLRATANLASTTNGTIAESADLISTFTLVYKDFDPSILADKLANAANISKLSLADLTTIVNRLVETTEGYTISVDSMLAATATLKNVGIKSSTISTGLSQAIIEVFSPDKKLLTALKKRYAALGQDLSEEAIKNLFIGFKDSKNELLSAVNELQKLGFGGTGAADFDRVFDKRAENVIRALVRNKDAYVQNIEGTNKVGSAAKGAATQLESLTNSITNLGSAFVSLGSDIGLSAVNSFAKGIDGITNKIKEARAVISEIKAETGETGAGEASKLGVGAGLLAFSKGFGGFKSIGGGLLAAVLAEAATLYTKGNVAVTGFIKAINDAAQAIFAFVIITKLGVIGKGAIGAVAGKAGPILGAVAEKAGGLGSKVAGGLAGLAAGSLFSSGGGAAAGAASTAGVAAAGAGLVAFIKASVAGLSSVIGRLFSIIKLLPIARLAAIGYFAYQIFEDFFANTEQAEETYEETQQALAKKIEDAKIAEEKLKEKSAGQKEVEKNTKDFVESVVGLKGILAEYSKVGPERIKQLKEAYKSALGGLEDKGFADIKELGKDAFSEEDPKLRALLEKAIAGTKDIGTQAFQDTVNQVEKLLGLEEGFIDKNRFATQLQTANDAVKKAEASRAAYVRELELALDKPEDPSNKAVIDVFNRLPDEVKGFLQTTIASAKGAERLLELTQNGSLQVKTAIESTVASAEATFSAQREKALAIADDFRKAKDESVRSTRIAEIKGLLVAAVKEGSSNFAELLVGLIRDLTGEDLASSIDAAKENAKQKLIQEIQGKLNDLDAEVPAEKAKPKSLTEFAGNQSQDLARQAAQDTARETQFKALEEERLQLSIYLRNQYEAQITAVESGTASEEELAKQNEQLSITSRKIAELKNKQSQLVGENIDAEAKVAAVKRGFIIDEQEIAAKEKRLAQLLSAKVQDTAKQVALANEIFQAKQAQLVEEHRVLEEDLRKKVESASGFSAKGLSGGQILDLLNNELGAKLLADNEELSKSVKAYSEVLNQAKGLEEKYLTDLQNIYGKLIEEQKSKLTTQENKTQALESELQTTTSRLTEARDKLADQYEKVADAENFYAAALRKNSGEATNKRDLQDTFERARENPSQSTAREIVGVIEELRSSGKLSKKEAASKIKEAQSIELDQLAQEIADQESYVSSLEQAQKEQTQAVYDSIQVQQSLQTEIARLTAAMESLPQQLASLNAGQLPQKEVGPAPGEPPKVIENSVGDNSVQKFATGGKVYGPPGVDKVDAKLTAEEFVMPVAPSKYYGEDFLTQLKNMQIPKSALIKAPSIGASSIGSVGSNSLSPRDNLNNYHSIKVAIGDATIDALAQPDAIGKFKRTLRLQALKSGKRSQ